MYIVTGGVGFIGTCVVQELNRRGIEDIIIVDRLDESVKWKNLREIKFNEYINADEFIELIGTNTSFNSKIKGVIHLGACSSTTEMDMEFLMDNNVNYSKDIFNFCTENDVPLLYASSAATYGDGEKGYDDNHDLLEKLRPLNPYGLSKHLFDLWVLKQEQVPSKWYGIKFFNVFGPFEYHKGDMRSVVHKSYGQIKKDGVVRLFKSHKEGFKDGEQLKRFYLRSGCGESLC